MRKNQSSNFEDGIQNNLAITSSQFLKSYNHAFDIKNEKFNFTKKHSKLIKRNHHMNATFFIKKNLIVDSVKNPTNPLNELWNTKISLEPQKCNFFPFIQERDHLNRLIQEDAPISLIKPPSSNKKVVLFQKYEINLEYPSKSYYHDSKNSLPNILNKKMLANLKILNSRENLELNKH